MAERGSPSMYPFMRYRDARAAITWLCEALGFEEKMVHETPDGRIAHAELRLGNGIVMLGSADDTGVPPAEGRDDTGVYVLVEDIDKHHARSTGAGARIVRDLADTDYGSREYSVRDPEGYVWSFGTYDPFTE